VPVGIIEILRNSRNVAFAAVERKGCAMPDLIGPKTLYLGFCGPIDSVAVGKIAGAFNQAVNDQFDAVHMTFTSPGGAASDGVFLHYHIRSLPIEVTIHNQGMVASVATTIYAAAHRRTACPDSIFMIHPVSMQANGYHASLKSAMDLTEYEEARIDRILAERTAIPEAVLHERRNRDIFFTAEKALEYGLVGELRTFTLPPGEQVFHL
jgi:ATP-dependent Clp protease, protease subunit